MGSRHAWFYVNIKISLSLHIYIIKVINYALWLTFESKRYMYSNVPKVFVKFVDVTLQIRCVTNLKCTQHRHYLANAVEISYVAILMLYIRPCKVTYLNVINLVIYQYGMQTGVAATWTEVLDAKCGLMYVKKGNRDGKIIYECIRYCKEILFQR